MTLIPTLKRAASTPTVTQTTYAAAEGKLLVPPFVRRPRATSAKWVDRSRGFATPARYREDASPVCQPHEGTAFDKVERASQRQMRMLGSDAAARGLSCGNRASRP
jgi:hypothetical protein